jgi:2-amino-4-hydroxy-6-hydroxymethyldihydropteridine diphosphokinase / dihydropteroate synthase
MWQSRLIAGSLIPQERLPAPLDSQTIQHYLEKVEEKAPGKRPCRVTAMSPHLPLLKASNPARTTHVMAILNLTPDSFSDGNIHSSKNVEALEKTVQHFIKSGATIIDIGGQSTRPNAENVSREQELERILPAIKHIRSMPEAEKVAISVDTFYARVAEEAIAAGADIINDVTAGTGDPLMLATAARLQKTIILMHMRGTPQTMAKLTEYPDGVIEGVGAELSKRVDAAKAAGVLPWRIILDPGIGFAKTQDQNLELLRHLDKLCAFKGLEGLPWLLGPSRKSFIGKITDVQNAHDRAWGTAATVTASIRGGADIVRVHDVAEMAQVAKMADAIFRV